MILAALIEYRENGVTKQFGVTDCHYTDTSGVDIDLWYPVLQSDVQWSEQARHPYQEQGGELTVGDLLLANDGTFDWLIDADIVGMKVTLRRGEAHQSWAEFEPVFIARTSGRRFDGHSVVVELDNWLARLSGPIFTETFGPDTPNPQLIGKNIPYVLGKVTQAPVHLFSPQELGYYTAGNASLIGEVTEGGNPTQKWYLDEQPIFKLKGSPTLPITATFEGPSDTPWTVIIDDDLNDWVSGANEDLGDSHISQGDKPRDWTLVVGTRSGLSVSQDGGLRINDASTGSSIAEAASTTVDAETSPVQSSSAQWADAHKAVKQDAGAATITTGGDKTDEIKVNVGGFQSASVGFRTSHSVVSGTVVLESLSLYKEGMLVYQETFNSTLGGAGRAETLNKIWDSVIPSDLQDSVDLHLKLRDDYSGEYSLSDFFIFGRYVARPSVHLRRDFALVSGQPHGVHVEGNTSDDVSFMWGAHNNTEKDWPKHNEYAEFINQQSAEHITGGFELDSNITPSGSVFNLSYQPAYGGTGLDSGKGDVTLTRIKITKQSGGNKSYKGLVPHIVEKAGYTSAEVEQSFIDAHADEYGDPEMGWLITGNETADQALFRLAGSLFGYVWHGLDGKVRSKKLEAPGPVDDPFVIDSTNADPQDIRAYDDEAPNLRRSVNALRNWQPIRPDRTAGITSTWTEEDRAKVTADWRITRAWEMGADGKEEFTRRWPNVAAREPFATALRDSTTAQLVANQGPDQWIEKPMFYEVPVYVPLGQLSKVAVGETVKAELDYPGLDNEWLLVLGRAGTAQPGMVNLTLWKAGTVPVTLLSPYRVDPRITATRNSEARYIDSDGVMKVAAIDELRLDHELGSGTVIDHLIEDAATNLLTRSEELDHADWVKGSSTTVTADTDVSPDGSTTMDEVSASSATGAASVYQNVSVSTGTQYTFSFYAKAGTISQPRLAIYDNSNAAFIDVDVAYSVTGTQRITHTFTAPAGCTSVRVYPLRNPGDAGTISFWGAQLETGAASSYIPTISSSASRSADSVKIDGVDFNSLWNASEGTFVVEATPASGTANQNLLSANDGTSNERIGIRAVASTGKYNAIGVDGGSVQWNIHSPVDVQAGVSARLALGLEANNIGFSGNQESVLTDTTATIPTPTQLQIGDGAIGHFNGHLRLYYYPKRLTNAQLEAASVVGRDLIREKI